jgi:membrane AbrB-like protein
MRSGTRGFKLAVVFAGAAITGYLGALIHLPLPWMIGGLCFAAAVQLGGFGLHVPAVFRQAGQILVATTIGMTFTPGSLALLSTMIGPMIVAALLTILFGVLLGAVLTWLIRVDFVTACLASIPLGPVEAANIGRQFGLDTGALVFAQTLRVVFLVIAIPPALILLDGTVTDSTLALRTVNWTVPGGLLLLCCGTLAALLAHRIKLSNAFFIGPLAVGVLLAVTGAPVTAYPYPVLAFAQLCLGVWLGAVLDPAMLRRVGSFAPAAVASSLLLIGLCVLLGLGLVLWTGEDWQVMILATAPGSATEMALTSRVLHMGSDVVTAFHVLRIFMIVLIAPTVIRWAARMSRP